MNGSRCWSRFHPYQSVSFCQSFLKQCYGKKKLAEPMTNSYKNGYPLCYYLEHAKQYYSQADCAPDEIKPVLLFYGMVQLFKACLLTVDPDYPEKTHVLAHGVSSRKRKKQSYGFLDDSVKIQKLGLFPHIAEQLFHMKPLEGQKVTMGALLKKIPELHSLFERLTDAGTHRRLNPASDGTYAISSLILDDLHVTGRRFGQFLKSYGGFIQENKAHDQIVVTFKDEPDPFYSPFFHFDVTGDLYLPRQKECEDLTLTEPLVHYLILYNLSMISRYETEWWYDLHFQRVSTDLSFIKSFLEVTSIKVPYLVGHYLQTMER
ncbi:YaaC-like protein [Scopulibacillus darangshiensis]|uniref:YaaC-like protein n=1 Tax=Scopulibacillus darangshiensis TaxID=442528 RepID=A0A4R2NLJ0_9BACL|nr:YaaC family protein [Scopulibacillus darangshiensis]TCP22145.1 YaaC-like protein [Scopulibacillus darangshiensis]